MGGSRSPRRSRLGPVSKKRRVLINPRASARHFLNARYDGGGDRGPGGALLLFLTHLRHGQAGMRGDDSNQAVGRVAREDDRVQLLPNSDARLRRIQRGRLLGQRLLSPLMRGGLLASQPVTKLRARLSGKGERIAP